MDLPLKSIMIAFIFYGMPMSCFAQVSLGESLYTENAYKKALSLSAKQEVTPDFNSRSSSFFDPLFIAYLPKVKYEFCAQSSLNIGLSLIDYQGDDIVQMPAWYYRGPFVETGFTLKDQRFMCNKIGYEYFFILVGGRLNLVHYTDFHSNQFFFRPELGISLFSVLTLTYGYNINLHDSPLAIQSGSVFSLNMAYFINRKKFRD